LTLTIPRGDIVAPRNPSCTAPFSRPLRHASSRQARPSEEPGNHTNQPIRMRLWTQIAKHDKRLYSIRSDHDRSPALTSSHADRNRFCLRRHKQKVGRKGQMDLIAELPRLMPLACSWAEEQSALILRTGCTLSEPALKFARLVGVQRPALVRVLVVPSIPAPTEPALQAACAQLQFLGPDTAGLTLGSGIFVRQDSDRDSQLLAHELRHVAQYEQYPSIKAYLSVYIPELIQFGYANAPMELDAQRAAARCV